MATARPMLPPAFDRIHITKVIAVLAMTGGFVRADGDRAARPEQAQQRRQHVAGDRDAAFGAGEIGLRDVQEDRAALARHRRIGVVADHARSGRRARRRATSPRWWRDRAARRAGCIAGRRGRRPSRPAAAARVSGRAVAARRYGQADKRHGRAETCRPGWRGRPRACPLAPRRGRRQPASRLPAKPANPGHRSD